MTWFNWFKKKAPVVVEPVETTIVPDTEFRSTIQMVQFRQNMWVMTPRGVGILFRIGSPCEVHLVSEANGHTIDIISADLSTIRQARYDEIPGSRQGIDRDRAKSLGYL
jgi:hypothetical protein